jgi:starch-binding outer membrane protein SusE/F
MRKLFYLLGLLVMAASGCSKNIPSTTLHSPSSVTGFTSSASTVVLSNTNDSQTVVTLNWPAQSYGYGAAVSYTVLVDQPSDTGGATGWVNAIRVAIPTGSMSMSWLGTDFNVVMNQLGLTDGSANPVVIRLKVDVNQSNGAASTVPSLVSDVAMTVTPYKIILIYPKLYVAGDFLNPQWTQINQPGWILASVLSNNIYEGYVNFPNAGNNFKLCTELDWNGTNYGWGTSGTTISGSGSAGNCYFAGPTYCRVAVDVSGLTITYSVCNWAVAGDFNSWSPTANPMTFDPGTNQWTATGVTLTAGTNIKFVADPNWNTNFGVNAQGNLAYNGPNIPVAKSGTFTVTLDLSQGAGNYSYSVK